MDFKQIEAFVNVVRYKSFSKAADATFFTQPTISTHIRNLEKELGVKLLDRKSRVVEMTPQGSKFYKYAVEMINARAQAIDALGDSEENIEGILEVQTSSIPSVTFLPELLAGFRSEHDRIRYYVSVSDTQTVVDNICDRRGDIGFVGEEVSSGSVECVRIAGDRTVMITPKSYDVKPSITLSEAMSWPFIWRETGSATRKTFEAAAQALGYDKESFEAAALVDDVDALVRSVEAGLGVAIVSEHIAEALGGKVNVVNITDYNEERSFYMIRLRSISLSPAAEAFWDYINDKVHRD
ncbi:MAG: LysR family transcriptional regulator [Clostridiales bacterium]|jgi:DNA-binding transcriptional LysR family regulator|nr:LysR family transcriptional regulator [Clostridiales bacterium]